MQGLDPATTYSGRAVGVRRDGTTYHSEDIQFTVLAPDPPSTRRETMALPLRVHNPHPLSARDWPVTHGVLFPRGELGSADHLRLTLDGHEVPAQIRTTCRWLDGSVKWILLTFQAASGPSESAEYILEYGLQVTRDISPLALIRREGDAVTLRPGPAEFRIDGSGHLVLPQERTGCV